MELWSTLVILGLLMSNVGLLLGNRNGVRLCGLGVATCAAGFVAAVVAAILW